LDVPFTIFFRRKAVTTTLPTKSSQTLSPIYGQDPFRALQNEMDNLIAQFETNWNGEQLPRLATPSLDLSETDGSIQVRMDMPGIKPSDIQIEVTGNTLRVRGERKEEKEEKGKSYHRMERRYGMFARSVTLPCEVNEEKIEAECHDGVLTVTLPKTEPSKTKKIKVKG
jgi:HSP20 family protein